MIPERAVTFRQQLSERSTTIYPALIEGLETRVLLSGKTFSEGNIARLRDADGTFIELSIQGPGKGAVQWNDGRLDMELKKTAGDSSVILNVWDGDGKVHLGDVTVESTLGSFIAPAAGLMGSLTVDRSLERIELGSITGADMTVRRLGSMTVIGNGQFDLRANAAQSIEVRGDLTRSELHHPALSAGSTTISVRARST